MAKHNNNRDWWRVIKSIAHPTIDGMGYPNKSEWSVVDQYRFVNLVLQQQPVKYWELWQQILQCLQNPEGILNRILEDLATTLV